MIILLICLSFSFGSSSASFYPPLQSVFFSFISTFSPRRLLLFPPLTQLLSKPFQLPGECEISSGLLRARARAFVFMYVLAESNNTFQSSDGEIHSFARKSSMHCGCEVRFLNSLSGAVGNCPPWFERWRTAVACSWGSSSMDPSIDPYWFSTVSLFQSRYTISC